MVKLGQNFLVDRNILDVIERLAGVAGDDVVLEVGGGQGVLSERLAAAKSLASYKGRMQGDSTIRNALSRLADERAAAPDNAARELVQSLSQALEARANPGSDD